MSSALEAAGVPHWHYGAPQCRVDPFSEIAYDGYKIVVCDEDLAAAIAVIGEALSAPVREGERLSIQHFTLMSLLLYFFLGVFLPLKLRRWHDV
ncbi:MAG: hypothetical protein NT015_15810 [Alphaproteobacteria bacterium]|nr:hypothetical protein [Alphaproteobacteria bacterium]